MRLQGDTLGSGKNSLLELPGSVSPLKRAAHDVCDLILDSSDEVRPRELATLDQYLAQAAMCAQGDLQPLQQLGQRHLPTTKKTSDEAIVAVGGSSEHHGAALQVKALFESDTAHHQSAALLMLVELE